MTKQSTGMILEHKSGIPLYIQLKGQIKKRVQLGHWPPGHKLPPERELAEELGISRNTVSSAYRELELEGVLISQQGKGTFVAEQTSHWTREDKKAKLIKVLDLAIEEAIQLSFRLDEFLLIAVKRAQEKKKFLGMVRVAFVAGTLEYCQYFVRELQPRAGISIKPLLFSQLHDNKELLSREFADIDLVVTTFFYLHEVRQLLSHLGKPVIGIAMNIEPETVVELARIPANQRVGLFCRTGYFAENIIEHLNSVGMGNLQLMVTQATSREELLNVIDQVDVVAVSFDRKEEIVSLLAGKKPVIELKFRPDLGSVGILKTAILELQEKCS
ncbi:MAG: GntR family transcriptional regulator [Firmicutes bacterium]|nr:GntR family transcriptional regulator [Bacillota bacterium]